MKKAQNEIKKTIQYFLQFDFAPSANEIYAYLRLKISEKNLTKELEKMTKGRILMKKAFKKANFEGLASEKPQPFSHFQPFDYYNNLNRYTLPQYSIFFQKMNFKFQISNFKLKKAEPYVKLISIFPQIKLIGLSGSVAMLSANKKDDIDLFIISSKNRIWTARFISVVISYVLGVKRRRGVEIAQDKICLNLFFDEKGLKVPKFKQNEYVAHEILQMKPWVMKNDVYKRFIEANEWVFKIYPNSEFIVQNSELNSKSRILNSKSILNSRFLILNFFGDLIELLLKGLQLVLINRRRTTEIITDRQLWFFPDDFEKKVKT